jgi:hypothetical protein
MTLDELALKYGTDKSSNGHNYCPFYELTLPTNPKRLLEIGCLHGASARMWREWFPETEVHVLDLFEENPIPDIPGVVFHKGNQTDPYMLHNLRKLNFDVILDDGSHNSRDQMMTFFGLFNGGHYYIEDIHCCSEEFYREGLPVDLTAQSLFVGDRYGIPIKAHYNGNLVLLADENIYKED